MQTGHPGDGDALSAALPSDLSGSLEKATLIRRTARPHNRICHSRGRIGGNAVNETTRSAPRARAWAKALHVVVFVAMSAIVVPQAASHPEQFADPALLAWAAAIALVDLLPVPVWGSATVGMDLPLSVAPAILYPAPVAGTVAMVGAFDPRQLKGEIRVSRALFNRAEFGLATMVVG